VERRASGWWPVSDPILKPIGESLWAVYPERATFEFARVAEHRDSLSAEVTVTNADGQELHWGRINLVSSQGRAHVVKAIQELEPTDDWRPMVERACRCAVKHIRTGEPAVPLEAVAPEAVQRWAVDGYMPARQITVLFGDGGAGKSYVAMSLALSGLLDRPITARWRMMPLRRVLYLDWEADRDEQAMRLWELTEGLRSHPVHGSLLHRTMRRPLKDEITAIRAEVDRHDVDLVIADSLAPASGPESEHADAALTALQALRSLRVTVLCIAHVNKLQADSKAPARPYGSVHIQNIARSTIEARGEEGQGETTVSFYQRKANRGGRSRPPSAMRFTFETSGAVTVSGGEPDTGGASLAFQLLDALKTGPKDSGQLAEELDSPPATVKKALQRLENRDTVVRLGDGHPGHGKKQQWALTDRKRDMNRDTHEADVPMREPGDESEHGK
jgi:hypothetical protein